MLRSISCSKLVKSPLIFQSGLNALIGADDAHNSIGKSSVLMLIDFAFGGSDFVTECSDVMRNVGELEVRITFEFSSRYEFVRKTDTPDIVFSVNENTEIKLTMYSDFLRDQYSLMDSDISFRDCVGGFFRIYQRRNYDDKFPLDVISRESGETVKKRVLKIFGKYSIIADLEKTKAVKQAEISDIKGSFNSGAVEKITKKKFSENVNEISDFTKEIEVIKTTLTQQVTDISILINERNLTLKKEKDELIRMKMLLETKISRVNMNLSDSKISNSKSFQSVIEYFPDVDVDKLRTVEAFHKGITTILRDKLKVEKAQLEKSIALIDGNIDEINKELFNIESSSDETKILLERLMDVSKFKTSLMAQNNFYTKQDALKLETKELKDQIEELISETIHKIESTLNSGMEYYIKKIYLDNPIIPHIKFDGTKYKFEHNDDRGTGKAYANLIALDLTFLNETKLPILIHDSLLFKNMEVSAVEHLIEIYSSFRKQIFISIDEVKKYSAATQKILNEAKFLTLNEQRFAFQIRWNRQ